jgi:hypothetical protein
MPFTISVYAFNGRTKILLGAIKKSSENFFETLEKKSETSENFFETLENFFVSSGLLCVFHKKITQNVSFSV